MVWSGVYSLVFEKRPWPLTHNKNLSLVGLIDQLNFSPDCAGSAYASIKNMGSIPNIAYRVEEN